MTEWSHIVLFLVSSLSLAASLFLTLWFVRNHLVTVGPEPDWKNRVLSLFPFFSCYSLFAFLFHFTGKRWEHYTESPLILLNTYTLYQLYQLFLFFFNKQSGIYFQNDAYARIEFKKGAQEYLPNTIRAKTNYCFLKCVALLLIPPPSSPDGSITRGLGTEEDYYKKRKEADESHPCLVYGTKFLTVSEILLVGQILLALLLVVLSLSLGHMEWFAHYFWVISLVQWILCVISIGWIGLFLVIVEPVIHIYHPRFKLILISLPILSYFILINVLQQSLASFIIQMEQLFLLVSTLWVFSSDEHSHIFTINTGSTG